MTLYYVILALSLYLVEAAYISIARRTGSRLVGKNLSASGHHSVTGGGFIFFPAALAGCIVGDELLLSESPVMIMCGILWLVSFYDDMYSLPVIPRLVVQMIVVGVTLYPIMSINTPLVSLMAFLFLILVINSYNFMDGISGMLGMYSLVTIGTLILFSMVIATMEMSLLIAVAVFCVFNIVYRDEVYSGDVGSIVMGFLTGWLLILVSFGMDDLCWMMLVAVYVVDVMVTLVQRIVRRENIFKSHHRHLYQLLCSKGGYSHFQVSLRYALAQLAVNVGLFATMASSPSFEVLYCIITLLILVWMRLSIQRFIEGIAE